ncbi:MAG: hypothetical protein AVDCRST_MAG90-2397, partial [uncultured Microvirga sp.]
GASEETVGEFGPGGERADRAADEKPAGGDRERDAGGQQHRRPPAIGAEPHQLEI